MTVGCVICGETIGDRVERYERMVGFGKPRDGGGVSNLRLRVGLREYAHVKCVDDARLEIKQGRASLLDFMADVDRSRLGVVRPLEVSDG